MENNRQSYSPPISQVLPMPAARILNNSLTDYTYRDLNE